MLNCPLENSSDQVFFRGGKDYPPSSAHGAFANRVQKFKMGDAPGPAAENTEGCVFKGEDIGRYRVGFSPTQARQNRFVANGGENTYWPEWL